MTSVASPPVGQAVPASARWPALPVWLARTPLRWRHGAWACGGSQGKKTVASVVQSEVRDAVMLRWIPAPARPRPAGRDRHRRDRSLPHMYGKSPLASLCTGRSPSSGVSAVTPGGWPSLMSSRRMYWRQSQRETQARRSRGPMPDRPRAGGPAGPRQRPRSRRRRRDAVALQQRRPGEYPGQRPPSPSRGKPRDTRSAAVRGRGRRW